MKEYMVSVIVPVYNNEKYIPECIQSIEKQTYDIEKAHRDAEKLIINCKLLKESLVDMNKMIVSKGTIETSYRFSNKDEYINYYWEGCYIHCQIHLQCNVRLIRYNS